ncbi:hypothetical protein AKJ48_00570 [candidate division MSBL1 archaeon SCGC-AAA261O19]|uniref:4Fe-4S ferredoxin-type domain-containing protein n=1 Tax=candidate division MSBL1 archaeon SCGC-AAA261O19 TaxID=1698277 RepID=A0A133VF23_9EURY|nr:hypothetical protein AKJ48_00570 [candidate division MSBL1 archaeon SCGC-AAA261O19]
MTNHFRKTGVLTQEDLENNFPPPERREKGPVAVIEDVEEIPCNPCKEVCPFDAIEMNSLTDPPKLNFEKCTGCALCLRYCPGLAIFIVDQANSPDEKTWITIPYEYLPIPDEGDEVKGLDREGNEFPAKVVRVVRARKGVDFYLVTIEVDEELQDIVRGVRC